VAASAVDGLRVAMAGWAFSGPENLPVGGQYTPGYGHEVRRGGHRFRPIVPFSEKLEG
jgi:hypothetical protein